MFRAIRPKFARAVILGLFVTAFAAGTASADPAGAKSSLPVTANCGSGTINLVVNGNGNFTPALDLNSTNVFIPLQFGPSTGVFTDPTGTEFPISDPASPPKGSANPSGRTIVDCAYHINASFLDGSSLVVDGSVSGFFTR